MGFLLRPLDVEIWKIKITGIDTALLAALVFWGLSTIPVLNIPNRVDLTNPLPPDARALFFGLGMVAFAGWLAVKIVVELRRKEA